MTTKIHPPKSKSHSICAVVSILSGGIYRITWVLIIIFMFKFSLFLVIGVNMIVLGATGALVLAICVILFIVIKSKCKKRGQSRSESKPYMEISLADREVYFLYVGLNSHQKFNTNIVA